VTDRGKARGAPLLRTHGRYRYGPISKRALYGCPNGTRLAVYIVLDLEHFAFGEGLAARSSTQAVHSPIFWILRGAMDAAPMTASKRAATESSSATHLELLEPMQLLLNLNPVSAI
jgi:hypothetical protein